MHSNFPPMVNHNMGKWNQDLDPAHNYSVYFTHYLLLISIQSSHVVSCGDASRCEWWAITAEEEAQWCRRLFISTLTSGYLKVNCIMRRNIGGLR